MKLHTMLNFVKSVNSVLKDLGTLHKEHWEIVSADEYCITFHNAYVDKCEVDGEFFLYVQDEPCMVICECPDNYQEIVLVGNGKYETPLDEAVTKAVRYAAWRFCVVY